MAGRKKPQCITCERPAETCGLCSRCYQNARYAKLRGKITEQELIDLKLMLPKYSKAKSAFGIALRERLAGREAIASTGANESRWSETQPSADPVREAWVKGLPGLT